MSLETDIIEMLKTTRAAGRRLALAPSEQKNEVLLSLAKIIIASKTLILAANQKDLARARSQGRTGAFLERLALNDARIDAMTRSVQEVAALPDPVGEQIDCWRRPNGLEIQKLRVPLGLIAIIYESRPNVTVDAATLCVKSGNAVILRGGSEAIAANACLAGLIAKALTEVGLDAAAASLVENPDREAIQVLKRHPELIDLIIPRGGKALKDALQGSAVPLLPHFDG